MDAAAAARARAKEETRRLKDKLDSYKKGPCVDCKTSYPPYVMAFDKVSADLIITSGTSDNQFEEIAKGDLVCANCLRIRMYKRKEESRHEKELPHLIR